jgi:hypothetical protein
MLIECKIKREGPTHVTVAGFDYVFAKNEHGHKVCDVLSSDHQSYFLELKDFVPYEPPEKPTLEVQEEPKEETVENESEDPKVENIDGLILNAKGKPFANEAAAKRAKVKYGEDEVSVVPYEDGFALQRKDIGE